MLLDQRLQKGGCHGAGFFFRVPLRNAPTEVRDGDDKAAFLGGFKQRGVFHADVQQRSRPPKGVRVKCERYAALFLLISSRMMRRRVSSNFGVFPSTYSRRAELIKVW